MVPILTEEQFGEVQAQGGGYVVYVVSRGPCIIHRAGCEELEAAEFRSRVIADRGRKGGYLFGADLNAACAESGPDAVRCRACVA